MNNTKEKKISFSELKAWWDCPFRRKLLYEDRIREFSSSIHTCFGTAVHNVAEGLLTNKVSSPLPELLKEEFQKELKKNNVEVEEEDFNTFYDQGKILVDKILPFMKKEFKNYSTINAEEKLYEKIEDSDYKFKGFIDLIIKTEDGKYHIIDWKTTSWGWDSRKKTDPKINYQLTLYKHFYAKKYNIDPKDIETYFVLMKRTVNKNHLELLRVTSGDKKTKNALNILHKALYNIEKDFHIKNKLSCRFCEFKKTEYCP